MSTSLAEIALGRTAMIASVDGPRAFRRRLLEMGLVVASQLGELRRAGLFLPAFALAAPVAFGAAGAWTGAMLGFSAGGAAIVATPAASASYIAAPTAMRIAIPEASPALSLTAALGITFPFNLLVGIPLYHRFAVTAAG